MSTLVLKSFPEPLHKQLRALAKEHRRSVTQEAIGLLESAAAGARRDEDLFFVAAAPQVKVIRTKAEIEAFRKALKKMSGSGTVKMTADEILALTRGE